jgi:Zn-dependent protease
MAGADFIFVIIILIMSVILHELAHGYAALYLGDPTAKHAGRLTLNPMKHLDLFGSLLVPLFLYILQAGVILGWAKPVPYNPYNLRNQKWGEAIVAFAGPLTNFFIALVFGLFLRFAEGLLSFQMIAVFGLVILINIVLGLFNLIPIPPLDGSKLLFAILPLSFSLSKARMIMEQFGIFIVFGVLIFAGWIIFPILWTGIITLFYLFTGDVGIIEIVYQQFFSQ